MNNVNGQYGITKEKKYYLISLLYKGTGKLCVPL